MRTQASVDFEATTLMTVRRTRRGRTPTRLPDFINRCQARGESLSMAVCQFGACESRPSNQRHGIVDIQALMMAFMVAIKSRGTR